jgi:hypothetical protein
VILTVVVDDVIEVHQFKAALDILSLHDGHTFVFKVNDDLLPEGLIGGGGGGGSPVKIFKLFFGSEIPTGAGSWALGPGQQYWQEAGDLEEKT